MKAADLAVLGLIVEQPRHGYEIEKVIEARDMREWTAIGFSSIYAILTRLERKGWIASKRRAKDSQGPPRKQFSATASGRQAWAQASLEQLASPEGGQLEFLLGLTALPALPAAAAVEALGRHEALLHQRFQRVASRFQDLGPEPPLFLHGVFAYSLRLLQAELEWTREFRTRLEAVGPLAPTPAGRAFQPHTSTQPQ